ncbi:serine hydrolase [Duganella sp. FT80W]|uniref:Serine hydrolase n=1 Tax=Duganella guangzhouensis TaxID=2666084 RepID=A0A6I2KWW2_9BURK|nr:serine hydrolase [Duganella guangzhouensis]MRW90488.1 serine hydrolase [Duganella guangzhouensis]
MLLHQKWLRAAGFAVALLFAVPGQAQDVKRLEAVVDAFVASNQFSGSVLVAKGDQVLLDKGYGAANVEWNIANAPDTKFRLGSVTKQFTAVSVLLLQERGKLKVSDPVSKYVPDLPPAWSAITIAQLLHHTSGIPNFTAQKEYLGIEPFSKKPAEILVMVRDMPLRFTSGSRFDYSNSGYVLLGQLIEQVSGESYGEFVRKNIFEPLAMRDSGYDWNATILPHRAAGYERNAKGLANAGFINMSIPHAAGALYSTTGDLLRWNRGLYEGKLLKPESLAEMLTPGLQNYGYGVSVLETSAGTMVQHAGAVRGFSTTLSYRLKDKVSVIALSNVEGTQLEPLSLGLAAVAGGANVVLPLERKAITLTAAQKTALMGTYSMPTGPKFYLREQEGQLRGRLDGQRAVPLYAESSDQLFALVVDVQFVAERDAKGTVQALTLVQNGQRIRMARVADMKLDYDAAAIFLRGDMNEWSVRDRMRKEGGNYVAKVALAPGRYELKLGSEDWKTIDLGGLADDQVLKLGEPHRVDSVGPNLSVDIPASGTYLFTLNVSDKQSPKLNVSKAP